MNKGKQEGIPLVKGGQGKSDEQLQEDATCFLVMMIVLAAPVSVGIVWRALQCLNA